MFWNVENFFDWKDGGSSDSDREFSARGERHWSRKKFAAKCSAFAKTVLWIGEQQGRLPDAIGLAEVENSFVLRWLTRETILRKLDYEYVHYDSPDRRGIDVALLYRRSCFSLEDSAPLRISASGPSADGKGTDTLKTRDILLVRLRKNAEEDNRVLHILVNHHPSKFGGGKTAWRREAAVERLRDAVDSLMEAGAEEIIATGDFNDTPEQPLYRRLEASGLKNLAEPLSRAGEGTIRYQGRWELIDHFYVSPKAAGRMEIVHPPFLTVRDNTYSGDKPLRTFVGPRYSGGVSDHRPILLHLR